MKASRHDIKAPLLAERAPKKPFTMDATVPDLPEDITEFLRSSIPPATLKRMPLWFSHALIEAMRRSADEIEKLRLIVASHECKTSKWDDRRLAALILAEEYHDLDVAFAIDRHLPDDQRKISSDLIRAFDTVRTYLAREETEDTATAPAGYENEYG